MMTSTIRKFGVGVASIALVAGAAAPAMAAKIIFPDGGSFDRISGDSRVETAMAAAERLYKDSNKKLKKAYLVSASENNMVDAATSGMLRDGVVLLVPTDRAGQLLLGASIKSKFPTVSEIVAIGGTAAVSDDALANVKKMNSNISKTSRLAGENRYETNVAVAKAAYPNGKGASTAYLTRGDSIVEALTAGAAGNGPVLLVNKTGDVDKSTVDYYQSINPKAVVLGGEAALSDEQVAKLTKGTTALDPWTYLKSTAELKANLQVAAATYFGQSEWQQMSDSAPVSSLKNFDANMLNSYNYFGLGKPAVTTPTAKDPSKINIAAAVAAGEGEKAFVGFKTPMENLNSNVLLISNTHTDLKAALDVALRDALAGSVTAADLSTHSSGAAQALHNAVKGLYGLADNVIAPTVSGSDVETAGAYTFNDDNKITGLNTGLFTDEENKLVSGDYSNQKVVKIANVDYTLSDAVYIKFPKDSASNKVSTASTTGVEKGTDATEAKTKLDGVNWDALYNQTIAAQKDWSVKTQQAKENLIAAVKAYYDDYGLKLITSKGGGFPRLAGEDRYETSALLAVYLMKEGSFAHAREVDPVDSRAYLASGDDGHLIDSVVAGQLTDGPILLVPTKGEINKAVIQQLAYMKYTQPNLGTYMLGGEVAIADSVRDEAVNALKNAKDYKGAADWAKRASNSIVAPSYAETTLSSTSEVEIDPANSTALTTGAQYSIVDLSKDDATEMTVKVESDGKVKVEDSGFAGAVEKTVTFKVRAAKDGKYVDSATVTVKTKRSA